MIKPAHIASFIIAPGMGVDPVRAGFYLTAPPAASPPGVAVPALAPPHAVVLG